MKARNPNTGNLEEVYVKALDSMPIGTEVDFDGSASDIPIGWEQVGNGPGTIIVGSISDTTTIPTGDTGASVGSITLPAGKYIIQGILNNFQTNSGKWLRIDNYSGGFIDTMINLNGMYSGNVFAFVNIGSEETFKLIIQQYTGSDMTYTKLWNDKIVAIKISN